MWQEGFWDSAFWQGDFWGTTEVQPPVTSSNMWAEDFWTADFWSEGFWGTSAPKPAERELPLRPLQASFKATDLEAELAAMFIRLYDETLRETADEINVYGAPHLGKFELVERHVSMDGLAMLRQGDEAGMRYLFKAWRFRNTMRGTAFLRTYLQVLFGPVHDVQQLWQRKSQPYPTAVMSRPEMGYAGELETDYFLTSRLRVDLDTDIVPDRIIQSLRTVIAARFVLQMRLAKFFKTETGVATVIRGVNIIRTEGEAIPPPGLVVGVATAFGATSVLYTTAI